MASTVQSGSRHPGWLLDEVGSAGRENLDADHVARYDAKEDGDAAEEVQFLGQLGLDAASVVVDLGAGTGQFTLAVAPHCRRVVAVDVSPAMLDYLRRTVAGRGLDNVDVVQAGFLTYDHIGEPADAIYSRYALHHLPDAWKAIALTRMRSAVRTGGLLRLWDVVYDFGPEEAEKRFEAWCSTGGREVVGAWSRDELEEHVRDENSTFVWLLDAMIARAGFRIERSVRSEDGMTAKYLARAI